MLVFTLIHAVQIKPFSIVDRYAVCSETMFFLILWDTLGYRPILLGDFILKPHLRFAQILDLLCAKQYKTVLKKRDAARNRISLGLKD